MTSKYCRTISLDEKSLPIYEGLPVWTRSGIIRAMFKHLVDSEPEHLRQELAQELPMASVDDVYNRIQQMKANSNAKPRIVQ